MKWRGIAFGLLILLGAGVVLSRFTQLRELAAVLRQGRPGWLAAATALQLLALLNEAGLYASLYRVLRLRATYRELLPLVLAGRFINVVTPSAGLGGAALLLQDARRRGLPLAHVTLANMLFFILNFLWFAALLAFSLAVLFAGHELRSYQVDAAAILLVLVVVIAALFIAVGWRPECWGGRVIALAKRIDQWQHRWSGREVVHPERLAHFIEEYGQAFAQLRGRPGEWLRPWGHTLLVDLLQIVILGACLAAFPGGHPVSPARVVVAYSIGTLFLVLSVTPQGLGLVEGVMVAVLTSLGNTAARAAVAVLAYRGLSFWLPLAVGFGALRCALPPVARGAVEQRASGGLPSGPA